MLATARADTTSANEVTVRLSRGNLPVKPLLGPTIDSDAKTVRVRAVEPLTKPLPKAISAYDGKTMRLRAIELPVVAKVTNTVRQRYADLSSLEVRPPSAWEIARLTLVLLLASMPILGISLDVFGLVPQGTTSVAVIVLCAALGALITFAPHRMDMMVGRGLIAGMVACIVYDGARLFAVHVLGLMGDFIPVMGSWVRRTGHRRQRSGWLYLALHR